MTPWLISVKNLYRGGGETWAVGKVFEGVDRAVIFHIVLAWKELELGETIWGVGGGFKKKLREVKENRRFGMNLLICGRTRSIQRNEGSGVFRESKSCKRDLSKEFHLIKLLLLAYFMGNASIM